MNTLAFSLAVLMGLTGSIHCAGMCGPIIWIMPFQLLTGLKRVLGIFLYHFGRTTSYALLACSLHSFRDLFQPHIQQTISIVLGALLLLAGILSFVPHRALKFNLPWTGYIKTKLASLILNPHIATLSVAGFFNGLLPCGLVYMALSASVNVITTWQAIGFMYAFGIGTMPMLVSITLLRGRFPFRFQRVKRIAPLAAFFLGCLFIIRGMNMGIPYVSPKIKVTQHTINSSCCHKQ